MQMTNRTQFAWQSRTAGILASKICVRDFYVCTDLLENVKWHLCATTEKSSCWIFFHGGKQGLGENLYCSLLLLARVLLVDWALSRGIHYQVYSNLLFKTPLWVSVLTSVSLCAEKQFTSCHLLACNLLVEPTGRHFKSFLHIRNGLKRKEWANASSNGFWTSSNEIKI